MEQVNSWIEVFTDIKDNRLLDIIIAVVIVILSIMISSFFSFLFIKIFKLKEKDKTNIKKNPLYKSIRRVFFFLGVYLAVLVLELPEDWFKVCNTVIRILIIWNVAGTVANLISPESKLIRKIKENNKVHNQDNTIINGVSKFGKIGVYVIAVFIIISELDYDVNSIITGLGLTSVVIALAAQDVAENILSGMAIVSDRPFVVGDYVKIGTYEGIVTEVKFRCTRIRATDDTVVTIQNSTITSGEVVNYSRMTKRRVDININLPLETKSKVIENATVMLKSVLEADEDVIDDSVRVYFDNIGNEALNLKIYLYTRIVDYDDYLSFKTKANLIVIKALEMEGIKISYPGEHVYLAQK